MKTKKRTDQFLPYAVIIAIVAIVAIVSLFLLNERIEGAAIRSYVEEYQITCLDSDPVNDYYVTGTVRYGRVEYKDYCMDDKVLFQFHCPISTQARLLGPYDCPNGCLNGACI